MLLEKKRGLVLGVANNLSLAMAIANEAYKAGAELAFSYQGDALKKRVEPLAQSVGSDKVFFYDASCEDSENELVDRVARSWGELDFIVHSIGFSDKEELRGRYVDTSRENFLNTMNVSCFSLTSIIKKLEPLMSSGGSIATLSYYGAEKYIPNYNVMGVAKAALEASIKYLAVDLGKKNIRINGISAGPIKTLAASGIENFKYILRWNQHNSPLRRNITLEDVGKAGLFLLSDMSSGITGEVMHVDAGYNVIGMKLRDAPDIDKEGDTNV